MTIEKKIYTKQELAAAFPDVDPGHKPFGSRVLVQLRGAKNTSKGGIILVDDTKDTEKWNTQVGKIRSLGPVAFKNRTNLKPWPEGTWAKIGTFVRIPKWNQDKWEVPLDDKGTSFALFMLINDLDLLAEVTCDPLEIKAFI